MFARSLTMLSAAVVALATFAVVGLSAPSAEAAGASPYRAKAKSGSAYRNRTKYKRRPQVRGFIARRGGYSFDASDTVNTTVGTRSLYGGTNVFRDRQLDSQTIGGPFDHGFFFNSPVGPRGGDSPYHQ